MSCMLCSKPLGSKRRAIDERKCDRCYKPVNICAQLACNKKVIMNGYCSTHISLGRPIPKPVKVALTKREVELRNERRNLKIEKFYSNRLMREEEIRDVHNSISYDPIASQFQFEVLEQLIKENKFQTERELCDLDDELRRIKERFERMGGLPRRTFEKFNFTRKERPQPSKSKTTELPPRYESTVRFSRSELEAFEILKIEPTRDMRTIKVAFFKLALLNHPDKNLGENATAIFQEINEAYSYLESQIG